ncbi:MAG: cupin domain-containing protein [Lautropia sp.]|nr:cupin domain-containing protein [Lautropia sp.]
MDDFPMKHAAAHGLPPMEINAAGGPFPLGMPPERFLRDFWQKRPVLIRGAFPDFDSPIQPADLAGLSCEAGTLGRLISHHPDTDAWNVRTGPFEEDMFPSMPDHDWTLLVQDVDKWDKDVRALLADFHFLPAWRADDIMVSFAAPGGNVGAHVDNYDVFLLQGVGQRRWMIDSRPKPDDTYRDDVPLRLLRNFNPDCDWVLNPGDMLYLPPGVPHHGVAVDACLTISVGFRAPSSAELLEDYVDVLTFDADERVRYADPDVQLPTDPYEIDRLALDRAWAAIQQLKMDDPERFGEWFGRFISAYRVAVGQAPSPDSASMQSIVESVSAGGAWTRHPYSRMAWRQTANGEAQIFANGHAWSCPSITDAGQICAAAFIDAEFMAGLTPDGRNLVRQLAEAGHFLPQEDDGSEDPDERGL